MTDKNPIIRVVNGKICINDIIFELDELRESKEYLQSIGAEEAIFVPENENELDELHRIVTHMGLLTPEATSLESISYYLN
jgi:hypothetical protein